jgi:hypothetical protein
LEGLPSSAAIDWLLELRGLFGATEFLSRPWMQAIGRYRQWSVLHRWLLHEVYGPLEPGGERRGREKATRYQAWLRAIGVRRLRKWGLTVAQIVELYKSVGVVGEDEDIERIMSVERVIKRDAANVNAILMALLPSAFAEVKQPGRLIEVLTVAADSELFLTADPNCQKIS